MRRKDRETWGRLRTGEGFWMGTSTHNAVSKNDHVRTRAVRGLLGGWRSGSPVRPLALAASVRRASVLVQQWHRLVVSAPKVAGEEIAARERGGKRDLVDHCKRLLTDAGLRRLTRPTTRAVAERRALPLEAAAALGV